MMRKYYILFLLVFILFFFLTQGLLAQDFYVATDGSDSTGDGSVSNPWATITNALDWSPFGTTAEVTVTRTKISGKGSGANFNTDNDGNHIDEMTTKGGSVYDYQVCEAGTSTCSNVSRVVL